MAPSSTIRRAIGVVKDQTRISIAKVASNLDPELDILIVKATSHDDVVPNEKYFDEILRRSSISKELVNECVGLISKRIERTRDWIVALKCLILVHRLMVDGGDDFVEEIESANASSVKGGGMLSSMCVFKDEAHANSWDYTEFVRRYGMYLDEKVELMVFDEMWSRRRLRVSDGLNELEEKDKKIGLSKLSDEMATKRVLSRMEQLQRLLERVLAMRPRTVSKHQKLVVLALCPVVEESFKVYGDIGEGLAFLLDQFWGLEYWNVVKSLGTYVTVAKQIDELVEFYAWCKDCGVATCSEYPVVERVSDDLLSTMEAFMKKKAVETKSVGKKKNKKKDSDNNASVKRDEGKGSSTGRTSQLEAISENFVDDFQELISLNDVPEEDQGENAVFSVFGDYPGNNSSNNPWEDVPDNSEFAKQSSGCETQQAVNPANSDWELALVESASALMKQKTELSGGFDDLLLDSLYHQGTVSQSGSNFAWPVENGNAVLALPSTDAPLQTVNQQDPFAASVAVPPPAYVQIAEMERQQKLLVQEQQNWHQYSTTGLQSHTSPGQNVSSYYAFGPQALVPYEMPGNTGQPGGQSGQHYNPWSD